MFKINFDDISTDNETITLKIKSFLINIGDVFIVGDKTYKTIRANYHNDMFYMYNLTDDVIYKDMAFDTIYDMLDANFRHCDIKFITYKRFK